METTVTASGFVYGLRLSHESEYRYVGLTEGPVAVRLRRHLACARRGDRKPVYDWMRKHGPGSIVLDVLETVTTSRDDLGAAEVAWITRRREAGDRLLNVSAGGLGPSGVVWTVEQREAARRRSTGRRGVSRPGTANPFYGKRHSDEQRARWAESRKGTQVGPANPNFGKFGPDHPSYGHTMSVEARAQLAAMRTGPLNPNYGKSASAETRAKRRAAQLGVPKPSSARSAHTRYHTNQGRVSEACRYCAEDAHAATAGTTGDTTR
jgi:group I intron endonuclease